MQKKIMDLENKITQLNEDIKKGPLKKNNNSNDCFPRQPEVFSFSGHRSTITQVEFHPVYQILASASEDCTIKIWDLESGELERTLKGHTKSINDILFTANGNLLISCSSDLTIKIWDLVNDYKNIKTLYGHDHTVSSISLFGENLISASRDKVLKLWDISTGYCTRTFVGHEDWVRSVSLSEDGKLAVSSSNDQSIRVWDVSSGVCKLILNGHDNIIECVYFVPRTANSFFNAFLNRSSVSAEDQFVLTASRDKTVCLWDIVNGDLKHTYVGHDNWVRDIAFIPSSSHFITVSDDKCLKIWDCRTAKCVRTFENAHSHFISCIKIETIRGSGIVATGSVDQNVKIWGT